MKAATYELNKNKEMTQSVAMTDVLIELHVPDFDIVRNFYSKLGFEEVWSYPPNKQIGYLVMQREQSILCFFCGNGEVYNHSFFKKFSNKTPRGYGVEICLYISNVPIDVFYKKVVDFIPKKDLITPLEIKPWGTRDFRIVDPFGFYICVREPNNILLK